MVNMAIMTLYIAENHFVQKIINFSITKFYVYNMYPQLCNLVVIPTSGIYAFFTYKWHNIIM